MSATVTDIQVERERAVTLTFDDGVVCEFGLVELRLSCPCASCRSFRDRGEPSWPRPGSPTALTVTDAKPVVVTLTVGIGAEGIKWGLLAAAGVLTIIPGTIVVYFARNYLAKGFALGRI